MALTLSAKWFLKHRTILWEQSKRSICMLRPFDSQHQQQLLQTEANNTFAYYYSKRGKKSKTHKHEPAAGASQQQTSSNSESAAMSFSAEELLNEAIRSSEEGGEEGGDLVVEVNAGAGGGEASLFAAELLDMYRRFAQFRHWRCRDVSTDENALGGVRIASISVTGADAFNLLKYEGGVHRVQRIPITERQGRVHTSTVAVAVLPKPQDISVIIKPKDLEIKTCRSTGAGGQHVNKTESAVRMVHKPTGFAVECQEGRSQLRNRVRALEKLAALLYENQLERQQLLSKNVRKVQVGSLARSEKIRTYNFAQDRITDHRTNSKISNIKEYFLGQSKFHEFLKEIAQGGGVQLATNQSRQPQQARS